jgi:hypothetical protein
MQFHVGEITAACTACHGTEFEPDPERSLGPYAEYHCTGCRRTWMYWELISQIGDEALKRSKRDRNARR